MSQPNGEFYWDWYKHEENLATNRASFFLVGQAMLFAAYATLRAADPPQPVLAVWSICLLGIGASCIWLLMSILHLVFTRNPLTVELETFEPRRTAISPGAAPGWGHVFKSYNLMGLVLPAGILATWALLVLELLTASIGSPESCPP